MESELIPIIGVNRGLSQYRQGLQRLLDEFMECVGVDRDPIK